MRLKKKKKQRTKLCSNRLYRLLPIPCDVAQLTDVYHKAHFLTASEISEVLNVIHGFELPAYTSNAYEDVNEHNEAVHRTQYLSTQNMFTRHLPWLKQRLFSFVREVNQTHQWGFDTHSSRFNIRVAEYHEMDVGGSLSNTHHYDIGSLITIDIMLEGEHGSILCIIA